MRARASRGRAQQKKAGQIRTHIRIYPTSIFPCRVPDEPCIKNAGHEVCRLPDSRQTFIQQGGFQPPDYNIFLDGTQAMVVESSATSTAGIVDAYFRKAPR